MQNNPNIDLADALKISVNNHQKYFVKNHTIMVISKPHKPANTIADIGLHQDVILAFKNIQEMFGTKQKLYL